MIAEPKQKWPHAAALEVAGELVIRLAPACSRILIAGSLRREKPLVGDVEILYIPTIDEGPDPEDMFRQRKLNLADEMIEQFEEDGTLTRRKNKLGLETFGPKNKLMVHVASGIPVDLFSTSEENFWVSLVIRTGSMETNLRLTTGALERGRTLKAYGAGVKLLKMQMVNAAFHGAGEIIRAESERHVFELCGVPYLEPKNR